MQAVAPSCPSPKNSFNVAYVYQHPELDDAMTAYETLMLHARIRRWSETTAQHQKVVFEVLENLGLLKHMHTFVGGGTCTLRLTYVADFDFEHIVISQFFAEDYQEAKRKD